MRNADERQQTWIIHDYSHIQGMVLTGGEFGGDRTMFELCKYITIPCLFRYTMGQDQSNYKHTSIER